MSDMRAEIKIEFDFMGKKEKYAASINYFPSNDGLDDRIREWFSEKYNEGISRYRKTIANNTKESSRCSVCLMEWDDCGCPDERGSELVMDKSNFRPICRDCAAAA